MIGSFRISYEGAEAFEFVPPGILWRVFYDVDAKSVAFSGKGKLGGRAGEHLPFDAYDSSVRMYLNVYTYIIRCAKNGHFRLLRHLGITPSI